jgi:hypothetical protein
VIRHRAVESYLVCAACLAFADAAFAHHSPAAFDQTREVVVEGTITKVGWMNPHIYFTLATTRADGSIVEQEVQAGSASGLTALGVPKTALAVGKHVTVRGLPSRSAAGKVVWGLNLTTGSGATYAIDYLGRTAPVAPTVEAKGLPGRWLPQLTGLLFARTGSQDKLTEAARAARDDVASYRASATVCVAWPTPLMMVIPMVRDIEVDARSVRLAFDWMNAERVVHLDETAHPAGVEPTLQGHSIGHWDGGALVIDTVAFTPDRSGVSQGVPAGPRKHVVERLSLADDRLHLRYEVTIEDPDYLTSPVSFAELWDHRPDLEPSGEQCNPDVARRFLDVE